MFQNITNSDLKGALQALKGYVDRRMFLFGMFVFFFLAALVVGGVKVYNLSARFTQMAAEVEALQNSTDDTVTVFMPTPTPVETSEKTVVINAPVEIGYTGYNALWEYLEYGETVEHFHPENPKATLWFEYGEVAYVAVLSLDPPHYRALMAKFPQFVTYLKSGYRVIAEVSGDKVISVDRVLDSQGNLVWTPSMVKAPRELNPLEKWSLRYASEEGYEFLLEEWFDTLPECTDCIGTTWSPAEQYARAEAFFRQVYNPDNNLWVEIWGVVDVTYRWIDAETGDALECVDPGADLWDLPASGWLGLQICPLGKGTCPNPEDWETTYKIKVSSGFVVGIDQIGNVFESGEAGWVFNRAEATAKRTRDWTIEKMLQLLD